MTIALRGSLQLNTAAANAFSVALTGWTAASPLAGDLVAIGAFVMTPGVTWSQTAGTGTWKILSSDSNANGLGLSSFAAYRVFDGTETSPTFTSTGAAARNYYSSSAWTPDTGAIIALDSHAVTVSAAGTTPSAPDCTFLSAAGGLSLLLECAETTAGSSTALSITAQAAGWGTTGLATSAQAGNGTTASARLVSAVQLGGLNGTITPGTITYSESVIANIYQLLITEQMMASPPLIITRQAVNRAATY